MNNFTKPQNIRSGDYYYDAKDDCWYKSNPDCEYNYSDGGEFDDYSADYECDSGLSYSQQVWADRADYARELYESGRITDEQRAEIEMGA